MTDISSKATDTTACKRILSWMLLPIALFPFAALVSYDWRAISALNTPPIRSSNWIGALGDGFAYYGYLVFGLAIWIVPILCVIAAIRMIKRHRMRPGWREMWFLAVLSSVSCLIQVVSGPGSVFSSLASQLNICNAGGAIGYLVMTRGLSPLVSDFASSILMLIVLTVSVIAAIGVGAFLDMFSAIGRWATVRRTGIPPAALSPNAAAAQGDGAAAMAPDVPGDTPAVPDPYLAALQAREEAKRQREEEKQRIREEKLHAKEEKKRLKEEERLRKEQEKRDRLAARNNPPPPPEEEALLPPFRQPQAATAPQSPAAMPEAENDKGPYLIPSVNLLKPLKKVEADHSDVDAMSKQLIDTLKIFGVDATLAYTVQGPVVTKYALQLAQGTRYSAVTNIYDNLMGALRAKSLRIEAPIPGEDHIGIEVPNKAPAGISFREIFESEAWRNSKAELPLLFGKRADGKELIADLASMPHMLVAGATGQGKSVCLNSLICGLLMTRTPDQLKLIMVDPKMVEFTPYAAIPHLIVPVITENKKVVFSLHWAVAEMEKRLKLFSRARVRNIYDFNHRPTITQGDMFNANTTVESDMPKTVPYIVIIIDEAADLIGQCGKEVNPDIQRITQKARAAGIHLILATQRPDAKIITGAIKANIPGRVAFKTSSSVDSRTILDETGAENLIGKGDMLFRGKDNVLVRAQGAWISDDDIQSVTAFIEQHSNVQFDDRFTKKLGTIKEEEIDLFADPAEDAAKEKEEAASQREQVKAEANASDFKKAVECIINTNRASISHFQRRLGWGYNHSAKIMDMLEDAGIIGPQAGAGPRPIIMDQDQLLAIFNGDGADTAATPGGDEPGEQDDLQNQTENNT